MTTRSNSNQTCIFCGEKSQYYNSEIKRYVCTDPYQNCPTYAIIQKHLLNCPLPEEYHSIYPYQIKCQGLLYDILNSRKSSTGFSLKRLKIKYRIQLRELPCKYCGEPAEYFIGGSAEIGCCSRYARQCPAYHDYISKIMLKKYEDHPGLRDKMSRSSKIAQNRSSVKEAKSKAMKRLHNENCDECESFRRKYIKKVGRPKKNV